MNIDAQVKVLYNDLFNKGLWDWLVENVGEHNMGWWSATFIPGVHFVPIYIVDEENLIKFKLMFSDMVHSTKD